MGCLARRPDLSALRAAALVSVAANEMEAARVYAQKFVQESILACDWTGAAEIVQASPSFLVSYLYSLFELLFRFTDCLTDWLVSCVDWIVARLFRWLAWLD